MTQIDPEAQQQTLLARLVAPIANLRHQEGARLLAIGALLGVLAGLGAAVLDRTLQWTGMLLLGTRDPSASDLAPHIALFGPVLGGLVAGPLIYLGTRRARPRGVTDVIEAVAQRPEDVSLRDAIASALAASFVVGGGQSGGREGPIVQLGGAISGRVCRLLGLPRQQARVLVAAGAAGGLAASFNTPLGGAFFALEILLGNFAMQHFGPVVAASVAGAAVGQALLGDRVALHLSPFRLGHPLELPLFVALGLFCGVLALGFKRGAMGAENLMRASRLPPWLWPALSGLGVGSLAALGYNEVMGNGYPWVNATLQGKAPPTILFLMGLLAAKVCATIFTVGGRGGSGLFSPSIFSGAVAGVLFGAVVHRLAPEWTGSPSGYGMVGMGAFTAAVTHAPITTTLMLFEMTRDYQIIPPLLLALAGVGLISAAFGSEGIYTSQLRRRGVDVDAGREELIMRQLHAQDLLRSDGFLTVRADEPFSALARHFLNERLDTVYVLDAHDVFRGVVDLQDIKGLLVAPREGLTVADVERRALPILGPEHVLADTLPLFFRSERDELPVVDVEGHLMGVLRERDVVGAYDREVLRNEALLARVQHGDDGQVDFFELPPGQVLGSTEITAAQAGQTLRELGLPQRHGLTVLAIVRLDPQGRETRLAARADLLLKAGDRLVVLGPEAQVNRVSGEGQS